MKNDDTKEWSATTTRGMASNASWRGQRRSRKLDQRTSLDTADETAWEADARTVMLVHGVERVVDVCVVLGDL